jgi:hypothetical protein
MPVADQISVKIDRQENIKKLFLQLTLIEFFKSLT